MTYEEAWKKLKVAITVANEMTKEWQEKEVDVK